MSENGTNNKSNGTSTKKNHWWNQSRSRIILAFVCGASIRSVITTPYKNISNCSKRDSSSFSQPQYTGANNKSIVIGGNEALNHHNDGSTLSLEGRDMICYVSMGEAKQFQAHKARMESQFATNTSVFLYHSYDEDCDGCIFKKNSKYAEGKNMIVKRLMLSPFWKRCKYMTWFDDDVALSITGQKNISDAAWGRYHEMLLSEETTHPLIRPQDSKRDGEGYDTYQSCVDEHFVSYRFDHIAILWPLTDQRPDDLFVHGKFFFARMAKCYPKGIKVDRRYRAHNNDHRYNKKTKAMLATKEKEDVFRSELPELGPWDGYIQLKHGCIKKKAPSFGWHPECQRVMNEHLDRFLQKEISPEWKEG
ncbi:unnamed protein product [Cylindrotheca closterium]|uniref:Uncharacterized protein n=1 Tax=Cylindrotheca closterium TaxID=2856 RepID=A0AAD2PW41_9STRA|nr:unnamed protein product [Cylindrotheca closterium]